MRHLLGDRLRPLLGMLWLLGYLGAVTPLLSLATATVAWLDAEHEVSLVAEKEGIKVVLHHNSQSARTAYTHTHCLASQALTLLANSTGPDQFDHEISFQNGGTAAQVEASDEDFAPAAAVPTAPSLSTILPLPAWVSCVEARSLSTDPPKLSVSVVRASVFLI